MTGGGGGARIAGISEATGVGIGVAAGLLSWHTFWPVALLNVFIFAFYLRRVAAMTNDYRNKLSQGGGQEGRCRAEG